MSEPDAEQIEADLAVTRERLAVTIDTIAERVNPRNLAQQGTAGAKALVIDPAGGPRLARIGIVAGAVGAVIVLFVLAGRRTRGRL